MRKLSPTFINNLTNGFLQQLHQTVLSDSDLDLQIRDNYLNIYYKGNSLLNLREINDTHYAVTIHPKFTADLTIPHLNSAESVTQFLTAIPYLKENIIRYGRSSLEIEYEQLIIRANNRETRNNTEYFIIDRQYAISPMRFDLLGLYWPRTGRRSSQTVAPCLMEVKFALNTDIQKVHEQLSKYYDQIHAKAADIALEAQTMFR